MNDRLLEFCLKFAWLLVTAVFGGTIAMGICYLFPKIDFFLVIWLIMCIAFLISSQLHIG
jgi:hypothetical protein